MKVSVCLITYNHAAFVAEAIESVLSQQAAFRFELVVGEDSSTDATRQIVAAYRTRYPDVIRMLPSEHNLGIARNFARTLAACAGQYVALLDGDDYWISPHKLQRQVDFLDAHPDCALCFHPVSIHRDGDPQHSADILGCTNRPDLTLDDLLVENVIPTASVVVRANLIGVLPAWFHELPMEDWPLYLLLARVGRISRLPGIMAAYRIHASGAWSSASLSTRARHCATFLETVAKHVALDAGHSAILRRAISSYRLQMAVDHLTHGDVAAAREELAGAHEAFPGLLESEGPLWTEMQKVRSGYAQSENEAFIRRLFADVLQSPPGLGRIQSKLISLSHMVEVFEGLRDQDNARIDRHLWAGLRHSPMWLKNRGVFVTACRAILRQSKARWY